MKRLLTSTTALSLAFAPVSTLPLAAQVAVDTAGGSAICLTADNDPCPEGEVCFLAEGGDCAGEGIAAKADAALQASGGAPGLVTPDMMPGPDMTPGTAEAAPAEEPAGEAVPEGSPETAETAPEVPAEGMPEAPAAAVEAEAAEEPAEEAAAPETPAAEAAEEPPAAESAETAPAAEAPVSEPAAEEPAAEDAATEAPEAEAPDTEAPASDTAADPAPEGSPEGSTDDAAPETAASEAETPDAQTPESAVTEAPAAPADAEAEAATAEQPPQDEPGTLGEAATALQDILGITPDAAGSGAPAAAAAGASAEGGATEDEAAGTEEAPAGDVTETEITEENTRSSDEEFAPARTETAESDDRDEGMSDLERFGLVALGALAVGAVLKNGDRVLSNTGDRVVIEDDRGAVRVLKDDDTLLRRPGSRVRTESFSDGSTRSTLDRDDGSSIVTIRDASGRVLRRARYAPDGTELVLIDDLREVETIDMSTLPPPPAPRDQTVISSAQDAGDLARALAAIEGRENARAYSLRQIRDYREVRALAPTIDVESITFRTGSAAIDVTEAEKLSQLGGLIAEVLVERPYEIFLIEGHTDAVGSAASNLALSDRRAESVALALTEYFGIPPENLVVQGYGEAELRIATQTDEARNRRAAVRLISPLMRTAGLR
ncbi:OmpA family protein [Szabonella alba]|uniref:OmpA family protein n=1 Tax=Szabonella alba TaxID=2804194 RepID=A0A8K0Y1P5_9RHOB|nr:OmpA family protein [Szabonella alba]MBL4916249.1 OmpA family protein [Szabonella alba]